MTGSSRAIYFFAPQGPPAFAAQGFAAFAAQGLAALAPQGPPAFAAQGLAAFGAQGFFACADAGVAVAATIPPTASAELRATRDFLRFAITLSNLASGLSRMLAGVASPHRPPRLRLVQVSALRM